MTAMVDNGVAELRRTIAELQRRLDEALAREAATAEVLQVINSSPGYLQPVFDAMLEQALHLCGATLGELHIYDGAAFRTVAIRGGSSEFVELRLKNPPNPSDPGTISARILQTRRPVRVLDMRAEEVRNVRRSHQLDLSGARSFVAVPLLRDAVVLGYITMYRREVRPFTDKEVSLLENFAAQAVIAMENARLITETREALEQQTATANILRVISREAVSRRGRS
jgi:GAF domain-containing protein